MGTDQIFVIDGEINSCQEYFRNVFSWYRIKTLKQVIYGYLDVLSLDVLLYVIVNTTKRSFTSDSSVQIKLLLLYYYTRGRESA